MTFKRHDMEKQALSKLAKVSLLTSILVIAFISAFTVVFLSSHTLCYDDGGQPYYSDAPPGSALPCLLDPGANEIVKSSNLFTNGTFQFVIGDASQSVPIMDITMTPGFTTQVTTETTTTCEGCSTQTFTMTNYPNTPCTGLVPLVSHSYVTEKCNFSTTNAINAGQMYDFTMQFSDGMQIGGAVTAQSY